MVAKKTQPKADPIVESDAVVEEDEIDRTLRELGSREALSREDDSWLSDDRLPPLDLGPDWVTRYCRAAYRDGDDKQNMVKRLRQRWIPVTWDEARLAGYVGIPGNLSTYGHKLSKDGDPVEVEGMILCKRAKVDHEKAKSINRDKAVKTIQSLGEDVASVEHSAMPITQVRSTHIGSGTR